MPGFRTCTRAWSKSAGWFLHTEKAVNGERLDFNTESSMVRIKKRERKEQKSKRWILLVAFSKYYI